MNLLNEKIHLQGENISAFGQSVILLNKQLESIVTEVKTHTNRIDDLETSTCAVEKSLSQPSLNPSTSTDNPSLNDISHEIYLTSLCVCNIIIRGASESPDSSVSKTITADKKFIEDLLLKLDPHSVF